MKFFIVACAIVVAAYALTDEDKEKMKGFKSACMEETGIDVDIVEKVGKGDYSIEPDVHAQSFSFCMMTKLNVIDGSGHFKKDVISKLVDDDDKDKAEEAVDTCSAKLGAVTEKNAFDHCKCFHTIVPHRSLV